MRPRARGSVTGREIRGRGLAGAFPATRPSRLGCPEAAGWFTAEWLSVIVRSASLSNPVGLQILQNSSCPASPDALATLLPAEAQRAAAWGLITY